MYFEVKEGTKVIYVDPGFLQSLFIRHLLRQAVCAYFR